MADIRVGHVNILEASAVTVTGSAAGFPQYRLYDRITGRLWRSGAAIDQSIHVNQGGAGVSVDSLYIPAGHNLDGATLTWQWSDNDSAWSNAVDAWSQSGSAAILKTSASPLTHQYWRLSIAGLGAAPELGELYLTQLVTLQAHRPGSRTKSRRYTIRTEAISGAPSFVRLGDARRERSYDLTPMDATARSNLDALLASWDGSKPFLFVDHLSAVYFAEITEETEIIEEDSGIVGRSVTRLSFREIL